MNWFAACLYRWRIPLSVVLVIGAGVLLPRAAVTHVDNDIEAWFSEDDPLYRDYERFRAEFGGTQPLIIAVRVNTDAAGDLFTRERLAFLEEITGDIERVPTVARVQSLATASVLRASAMPASETGSQEDSLELKPLVDLVRRPPDETRTLALGDPMVRGELVSDDGRVAAVLVTFDEPRFNQARAETLNRIYSGVAAKLPAGLTTYYNGSIEINETYNRVTVENQRRFVPPILALTLIAVLALFRSVKRALVVLLSIVVSVIWTLGLYSLMGFGFNILTAMLTPLVVVLAISDDVHLIQHYDHVRRHVSGEEAFKQTVSYLFAPLLGASATTALGLLSLSTSDVIAIRHFGIGAAAGVMVDFAVSLILVPTLLTYRRGPEGLAYDRDRSPEGMAYQTARREHVAPHERHLTGPLDRIAGFATRQPLLVLAVSVGVLVVAVAGIARLRVDTNHIGFFSPTHPLSISAAVIDDALTGVYSFNILIEGAPDSLKAPDNVRRIDALSAAIRSLPEVRKTTSMADHVKRAHQELHGGEPALAVIPGDPLVVAQELFLISMADEGRRELERVVSSDFSTAQIVVRLPAMSSGRVFDLIQEAQRLASDAFAGTNVTATAAGSGRLFSTLDHLVVRSQISSFATAFVTIFAAMFLIFRSIRFGFLALVPNVLPVVAVLGVMGWVGITINIATVMVASVALGVVDDDTVHFIHRFRRQLAAGDDVNVAARVAAVFEGRAAFTTAFINTCGFAVLILSEYKPSAWFGGLLALTLGLAFLAEVLVLPAAVTILRRFLVPHPAPSAVVGR